MSDTTSPSGATPQEQPTPSTSSTPSVPSTPVTPPTIDAEMLGHTLAQEPYAEPAGTSPYSSAAGADPRQRYEDARHQSGAYSGQYPTGGQYSAGSQHAAGGSAYASGAAYGQVPPTGGASVPPQGQPQPGQYYQAPPTPTGPYGVAPKSKIVAGILGILLGVFGVHNFYLGFMGKAVAQLLITVVSFGMLSPVSAVWGLIEGVLILVSTPGSSWHRDAQGMELSD